MAPDSSSDHVDVLIVGAGLSGIGAAHHLQERCPAKSFLLLEARHAIGGTWDLFRYPGVRSDSDMYTFGYRFRPWTDDVTMADGPSILSYIRETATEAGIDQKIRFGHRMVRAEWCSAEERWTVWAAREGPSPVGGQVKLTAKFLFNCSGYYKYDQGFTPPFPQLGDFGGRVLRSSLLPSPPLPRAHGQSRAWRGHLSSDHARDAASGGPPAALAGGPRLRGEEGGCHRQRGDRGHARAGDGPAR